MSVRPSKIVAGHEPDKTNEWLQALGKAVAKNVRKALAEGTELFEVIVPYWCYLSNLCFIQDSCKIVV